MNFTPAFVVSALIITTNAIGLNGWGEWKLIDAGLRTPISISNIITNNGGGASFLKTSTIVLHDGLWNAPVESSKHILTQELWSSPVIPIQNKNIQKDNEMRIIPVVTVEPPRLAIQKTMRSGGQYVAANRGSVHVAHLFGHSTSVKSLNVDPAPGTL